MSAIGSRYARAFADVVFSMKLDPNTTLSEVRSMQQLVQDNIELRRVWEDPSIPAEQKRHCHAGWLSAEAGSSRRGAKFFAVLIDRRHVSQLDDIVAEFQHEINDRLGFAEAEIYTARRIVVLQEKSQSKA